MDRPANSQRGSTIVIALLVIITLGGASAALLSVSVSRSRESVMGFDYTKSLYLAEAGISTSMAEITADHDYDGDGLGNVSGNFDGGTYSASAVDEGNNIWTITSTGTHKGYDRGIEVVVGRQRRSQFKQAAFGGTSVTLQGNALCDSYDSALGSYASQATNIDPVLGCPYAESNGSVGSNNDITLSDNAAVHGNATPGPGDSVSTSGNAEVYGSTAPAAEDRELEEYTYSPTIPSSGSCHIQDESVTWPAGTYHYDSFKLDGNTTLNLGQTDGDEIIIYVDGQFQTTGNAVINVHSGTKVTIHHGGGNLFHVGGNGIVNNSALPSNLIIYSAMQAGGEDDVIKYHGNADLHGAIYAPEAPIIMEGNAELYGSLVGVSVFSDGNGKLHYDEALAEIDWHLGRPRYEAKTWRELEP